MSGHEAPLDKMEADQAPAAMVPHSAQVYNPGPPFPGLDEYPDIFIPEDPDIFIPENPDIDVLPIPDVPLLPDTPRDEPDTPEIAPRTPIPIPEVPVVPVNVPLPPTEEPVRDVIVEEEEKPSDGSRTILAKLPLCYGELQAQKYAALLAVEEAENNFFTSLKEAYEAHLSSHGPNEVFPMGAPSFEVTPSHIRAIARIVKDPQLGRGIQKFSAAGWSALKGLSLKWILGAVRHNPTIHTLRIEKARFDPPDGARIARFLQDSPRLHSLELPNMSGSHNLVLKSILVELASNRNITRLDISYAQFSESAFQDSLDMLTRNTTLKNLNLTGCDFSWSSRARRLMQALVDNPNTAIEHLDLPIMRGSILYLAQMLRYNTSLTYIDLSGTQLSGVLSFMSRTLSQNKSLRHLNLSNTSIYDSDLSGILEPLWTNETLSYLNISSNKNLSEESARNIGDLLMTNVGLQTLMLDYLGGIPKDKLAKKIAPALKINGNIQVLSMKASNTESSGAVSLADALAVNHGLKELYLSSNMIEDSGATAIFKALKTNKSLKVLQLNSCKCGDALIKVIIPWIKSLSSFKELCLYGNKISLTSSNNLTEAVDSNPALNHFRYFITAEESTSEKMSRYGISLLKLFTPE